MISINQLLLKNEPNAPGSQPYCVILTARFRGT